MLGFLGMFKTYEERKVENTKIDEFILDTCMVIDCEEYPYETALLHPNLKNGNWLIIKQYKTKDEAIKGHKHFIDYIKNSNKLEFDDIDVWNEDIIKHYTYMKEDI